MSENPQAAPVFQTHFTSEPTDQSPMLTETDDSHVPTPETMMDQSQTQTANNPVAEQQAFQVPTSYPTTTTSMLDDMAKLPFSDFLRDVLYDQSLSHAQGLAVLDFCDDSSLDLNAMDFGLLDYWLRDQPFIPLPSQDPFTQSGPSLTAMTATAAAAETAGGQAGQGSDPVDISAMRSKLAQIWTDSPWRWSPQRTDNVYAEQGHLPLSSSSTPPSPSTGTGASRSQDPTTTATKHSPRQRQSQISNDPKASQGQITQHTLHPSGRDLILSIVLSICKSNSSQFSRVASSFPSAGSINHWIQIFLASHLCSVSSFIPCHLPPSVSPSGKTSSQDSSNTSNSASSPDPLWSLDSQPQEWLAIAAAAGAVLAPVPALRKFGFALQEAVRVSIPSRFEENNSKVSNLSLVQALVLVQDLGVWSGNRRKMEIAECHLTVPIAMMRGRGKFTRAAYTPEVKVKEEDQGEELEKKWKHWMEREAWKRLAFHTFLREAQVGMTQLVGNMSIGYAEMRAPLPAARKCWFARSATEWKAALLESEAAAKAEGVDKEQVPCLGDLLRDVSLLERNWMRVDVQFAISIYLHGFWGLVWEYRQLASIHRPLFGQPSSSSSGHPSTSPFTGTNNGTGTGTDTTQQSILISRLTSLRTTLHHFHHLITTSPSLSSHTTPTEHLLLHLLLMHIHVSLEDLQLFSGKEGEEQAKRIYPVLQRWADSGEARQALWHAGQVLRFARQFPKGHLREFWAAGVHVAGLVVWGVGVLTAVKDKEKEKGRSGSMSHGVSYGHTGGQTGQAGLQGQGGYSGGREYGSSHHQQQQYPGGQNQQQQQHHGYGPQSYHHGYGYGQHHHTQSHPAEMNQNQNQNHHHGHVSSYMQQVMTPSSSIFTSSTPGATTSSSGATPASVATPATAYSSMAPNQNHNHNHHNPDSIVHLDGPQTPLVDAFIQHNTGRPSLSFLSSTSKNGEDTPVPLDDIAGCMEICQSILKDNFPDGSLPAISENIILLLGKLGGVAGVVGSGSS